MPNQLFWGDLHSHCSISYGYGSLERAFALSSQQLDFVSVVGHATWHDMPTDRGQYAYIIDYHSEGFRRLAQAWPDVQRLTAAANDPGRFVALLAYEWHSRAYGDHNIYYLDDDGLIVERDDLDQLQAALAGKETLIIPHHIGYGKGYRGINWETFDERRSPVIEIISGHGGSERDGGPYPIYHTMGPRSYQGTVAYGLEAGKRFGFVGGTDHHGGYPGHYGEGRTAIYAPELSRRALFDAIRARRCYAVTGDKIAVDFKVNGEPMGAEIHGAGQREIRVALRGCDALDRVEIVKNGRPWQRVFGPPPIAPTNLPDPVTAKIRLEWGWAEQPEPTRWECDARLAGGRILSVEPCFSGDPALAPQEEWKGLAGDSSPHAITGQDGSRVEWFSHSRKNSHPYLRGTNSLILEVQGPKSARLELNVNGQHFSHSLEELLVGSISHYLRGWLSEAILVHRAVPVQQYALTLEFADAVQERETDYYYVRVAQENNQWAWGSPVWVNS
ncbi:MAG: hypothetical protein WBO46_11105 [Caldilineaceae bacterium]